MFLLFSADFGDKYKSELVLVHTITRKSVKRKKKPIFEPIFGLAVLDKELFVVVEDNSEVEVYNSTKLSLSRRWGLDELICPMDIGSCDKNKCLYFFDCKGIGHSNKILRVNSNGKLIKTWPTGDDYGRISVTYDSNIIFIIYAKNKLSEYSPDGQMIRKINLSSDLSRPIIGPLHAIKLTNGDFVVSHGTFVGDGLHRVCLVDADGVLKKSFGGKRGSTIGQLDRPVYLSVDRSGFVMVADNLNNRILLLDSDLNLRREIISEEKYGLRNPSSIVFDEPSGQMFVADNEWNSDGQILVFHSSS